MRKRLRLPLAATSLIALTAWAGAAQAQTATASPGEGSGPAAAGGVQDIVVTATRRNLDLERVPATVNAVPASMLATFNITGIDKLPTLVPGLTIVPSGGNNIYLRGVGSASTGYNEAEVAVYIDGIFLPNPALSIYSFNNIDQIEVLLGPQGTLYGRNATGGLISITTHDPGTKPRLDASLEYANYNTFTQNFYASLPLTGNLAANLAVYHSRQAEGWTYNVYTHNTEQKSVETGIQQKVKWEPTSTTTVTTNFIYDYNNRDTGYAPEVAPSSVLPNTPAGTPGTYAPDGSTFQGKFRDDLPIDPSAPLHVYIGSLKVEQDVGFANLKSQTSYIASDQSVTFTCGYAGTLARGQGCTLDRLDERSRTFSQEYQLASKTSADTRFDWLAGAFYYNDDTKIALNAYPYCPNNVCSLGAVVPNVIKGYPRTFSISGYADGTYRFFAATRLTVGLRYTDEVKKLTGNTFPLAGFPNSATALSGSPSNAVEGLGQTVYYPGQGYTISVGGVPTVEPGIPTRLHFDKLTYRIVLAQDFGENVHAYLSDNLGFKAGAFNANVFTNIPALPEVLHAYEAGVKSELFERKLRLNVAYFHYDFTDVQVRSTAPPAPVGNALLENAASEKMDGVDADFVFVPTRELTFNGGLEAIHARYANYPGTTCPTYTTSYANPLQPVGVVTSVTCNLAGYPVQFIPKFAGNIGATYRLETAHGAFALNANDHYNGRYPLSITGIVTQPPHHIVDASLTWTSPTKTLDVQLWVKNLTNAYVLLGGSVGAFVAQTPNAPRTFGIRAGFHYY